VKKHLEKQLVSPATQSCFANSWSGHSTSHGWNHTFL